MPPIGTSRGYGNEPDDHAAAAAAARNTPVESDETHGDEHEEGHGHHAPVDPNWIEPTNSTLDDVYITAGDAIVDPEPVGGLTPNRVLDYIIPTPHAYAIDWKRVFVAGIWATLVFTPIWYTLYFGYKDSCFDLGLLLGAFVAPALDWTTRLIGLGIHLVLGIAFAATYAYVLLILRTQSTAGRGAQFGIGLCFAMCTYGLSLFVAFVARFAIGHPSLDMPDFLLQQAGPADVGYGPFVVALVAHLFYGAIVGGLYRHKVLVRQSDGVPALA